MKNKTVKFHDNPKPTVWTKWECSGGSRWTSAHVHEVEGSICCFSGCNCGSVIRVVGKTSDVNEASEWFREPINPKPNVGSFKGTWYDQLAAFEKFHKLIETE